jgi:hypothetical protein
MCVVVNCVDMPLEHDPARTLNVELDKVGSSTPIPTQIINTKRVTMRMPFQLPRLAMQIPCALADNALLIPFITQSRW